ncbi:hypothetical protein SIL80_12300 [Bacillus cereus group sp. BfR-BA-01119]|uniref:DUF7018 domain-containing (lipo)protein n=1 Tax=Bacillus cereus group TaxID=86661 RepID=UPI001E5D654E|nr:MULTISPECIES: hypothetical protein [Bacillus cereus group]MCC2536078.1 hypothetical protein [Bacillus paranthracis]MDA1617988.1 hypothetical protein [Bacillus cereus group sp. TH204-1LC]MDX5866665.1 hypothetical protein [Bacillus cereus group sp. BfR-BA-01119]MDX5883445.1 hypothetical protein [Bacillus cereus group sp. BfR-BA-00999]MDX5908863.1 hypothetical protein [Bacillus cereus group sp. BfR-BA-01029]
MKAKKLVSLALPVMLLSGCITIETDGKKADEPKKEEIQKVEKENKASEKESKSTDSKKEDSLSVAKGEGTNSSSSSSQQSSSSNSSTGSDVERYKADIINSATQIEDTMKLIEGIADSDVKSYKQKKSEVQLSLGGAKATTKKLKNLQAPPELQGEQAKIKQSMELYADCFQLLFDALDQEDESKMHQAVSKAQEGSKLFEEAAKSIGSKTN